MGKPSARGKPRGAAATRGGRVTRASTAGGQGGAVDGAASRNARQRRGATAGADRVPTRGGRGRGAKQSGKVPPPNKRGRPRRRLPSNEADSNGEENFQVDSEMDQAEDAEVDNLQGGGGPEENLNRANDGFEDPVFVEQWKETPEWKKLSGKSVYLKRCAKNILEELKILKSAAEVDDELIAVKEARLAGVGKELEVLRGDVLNYLVMQSIPGLVLDLEMIEFGQIEESILRVGHQSARTGKGEVSLGPGPSRNQRSSLIPDMQPTRFSGEISDWVTWWPQYEVIHNDMSLTDLQKFRYLYQCIKQGTEAYRTLERYPMSPANYPKVIQELKDWYGNPEEIVNKLVRELTEVATNASKSPINILELYEDLDSRMKALASLGWNAKDYSGILYPVIKTALPGATAEKWEGIKDELVGTAKQKGEATNLLELFMEFLKKEARVKQVLQRSQTAATSSPFALKRGFGALDGPIASVSGLMGPEKKTTQPLQNSAKKAKTGHADDKPRCAFDKGLHASANCWNAKKMSLDERRRCVREANLCFKCLRTGHRANRCTVKVKCVNCQGVHVTSMCDSGGSNSGSQRKRTSTEEAKDTPTGGQKEDAGPRVVKQCLSIQGQKMDTPLQTVNVRIVGPKKSKVCRAALDSGATKSTILKKTAKELGLPVGQKVKVQHLLFGGGETELKQHNIMAVEVESLNEDFRVKLTVMDQEKIVGRVINEISDKCREELTAANIKLSDLEGDGEIELLLGNDVYGLLLTGEVEYLGGGVTAIGTRFGSILSGPCEEVPTSQVITPFLLSALSIQQMFDLSVIGITDPIVSKTKAELEESAKEFFRQTVSRNEEGRYCVRLPRVMELDRLPDNKTAALKRLHSMVKRAEGYFEVYDSVLREWEKEGVIELVPEEELGKDGCHYLPHRMVLKEDSATTKVRPVFDASCKSANSISLNDTLAKGPNMLELIPDLLMRFRDGKYAAVADLKKAFLQIEVAKNDRDLLRFFWLEKARKTIKTYRHNRVVFGVNASPFLLAAVLEIHLSAVTGADADVARTLLKTLYVDNVVGAFQTEVEFRRFKEVSVRLMAEARFDLRLWESNIEGEIGASDQTKVLGLDWDKAKDTLKVVVPKSELPKKLTKRIALAAAQALYDPLGMVVPVSLIPKLLIREAHQMKFDWDVPLPAEMTKKFQKWFSHLKSLEKMELPRRYADSDLGEADRSLHIFCDASKEAFAAVAYLRTLDQDGKVTVRFVQARNRLSPEEASIPRKELLGAVIAARLAKSIEDGLGPMKRTFWTDSSTALDWIRKNENWGVFVNNRTKEIRRLTTISEWKFVPGTQNPADLPSRGADAEKFAKSNWWEGPEFLRKGEDQWPMETKKAARDLVEVELRRTSLMAVTAEAWVPDFKFWGYRRNVRAMAFLLRAVKLFKKKGKKLVKRSREEVMSAARKETLEVAEIEDAERTLWRHLQSGLDLKEEKLNGLQLTERNGLLTVSTKILYRKDAEEFVRPVLLPSSHAVVRAMIWELHHQNNHAGPGTVTAKLRERVWIRRAKKTVQNVLRRCVLCQLRSKKKMEASEVALPVDRVKDARVFEVIGIDYGGPLYLFEKDANGNNKKCWFLLITCAIYRAVHLELVSGLSTEQLIQALRRFIARRGRPQKVFSDNGTSFKGLDNLFSGIDWDAVKNSAELERIEWVFSPPTAAWWGGFWERMVGLVKDQLIKVLRRAQLNWEEMTTVLCDVEAVINSRPLTHMSEDSRDLVPLTPNMFLMDIPTSAVDDMDLLEGLSFERRLKYRQALKEDLRKRFRTEYLGSLAALKKGRDGGSLEIGDVVIVETENKKRVNWPLGRVLEVYPGKDGVVRVVKLKTKGGERLRPVQRLVKLELERLPEGVEPTTYTEKADVLEEVPEDPEDDIAKKKEVVTRSGRVSRAPERLTYLFADLMFID